MTRINFEFVFLGVVILWAISGVIRTLRFKSRKKEFEAQLKARRESGSDKRPTMNEEIYSELNASGEDHNWALKDNPIIARLMLEDDLGRFAEGPTPYDIDQKTRDIPLAHARKDAAEALAAVFLWYYSCGMYWQKLQSKAKY